MAIVQRSGEESLRNRVCDYLREQKAVHTNFRVLDVGGTANSWCDDFVDAYVDIVPPTSTTKHCFIGDINREAVWESIAREHWDFTICTHVLEDIRSPDFVIERLQQISSAGFIAVPNKHTEFAHIESRAWLGYCHHRWIFTLQGDQLRIVAKFPLINYFSPRFRLLHRLAPSPRRARRWQFSPGGAGLDWFDGKKVATRRAASFELGFIWENEFQFAFINNDYAGSSMTELAELYRCELRDGI